MSALAQKAARAELARAKVNLALHVTGQRKDGYHLLDSLVAFPSIGDRISVEPAPARELVIEGPFARDLAGDQGSNLIERAVDAFEKATGEPLPPLRITLSKRLPIASGIGGGSSDAATALRLLEEITGNFLADDKMKTLALSLGADVPVCLDPGPQFMRGIGEEICDGPMLPTCGMVLVNPKESVETPAVFRALQKRNNAPMPLCPEQFSTLGELSDFLKGCRNDLEEPAVQVCAAIGNVLAALKADDRVRFARMSGSGATCFALCERDAAMALERDLRAAHPDWWVASGNLA